ncbi:MAG: MiaB/RimO family radical SAM methylthiotransferase [Candidatus Omnitrophica bacterium]|nr:MiaB/RimO family radical SAM methylthiotransferase [Candidatus Omnitrophota bacterium]MBU4303434.1 MiaB/RimO family radical SAM methylthiotransferase [Candidatus Omnitrophota bacterium]MBU4418859.1 MiaB/RimO family radical SAM methylthiotransferase [Candidatus Omnitrophota bacterium]MBU4467122.1 MiaB/RimO family radical SAM methylthiotransferase [Candidatus Omnitrophota bacterium]MCG2708107.1 MiaB/RimO family radical SAM methylthiotransferase [Candidatus Omnitrophota bacterium]
MNVRDSEVICGLLQKAGYRISVTDQDADVIIFNTCSVRKHAEDRVWSLMGSYKGSKIIGLVGCMAQNYKEQAFTRDANISFVVGPQDIDKIPKMLGKILETRGQSPNNGDSPRLLERKIWETEGKLRPEEIYHTDFYQDTNHAYVVISEGCSNFCSYCVVPYVRGPLRHRKHQDILIEIREAIARGITKVTLLGQNVNAYQDNQVNFTKLLGQVNALEGIKEFDFFTSHPKDAGVDSFKAIRDLDKLAKRLHLPLQSGADRILKSMNRGYAVKDYLALIDSYRKIVKGGRLTTDIIVGFPTETDQDFKETCALVKKARFNAAYIFKYSSRPGTEAAKMADELKPGDKEKRHKKILDLQRGISKEIRSRQTDAKN